MKHKTSLIVALVLLAGVLSVLTWASPSAIASAGSVGGMVLWIDQYGNARPMAWAEVTADDGVSQVTAHTTTDGTYMMWLPAGSYDVTASSSPGFYPDTKSNVVVSPGSSTSIDFTLQPTGEPIPELPQWSQPLIVLCTVAITAIAVRRHRVRNRA